MARRLRIGLTGGIASGKTTVAQRFSELGVPVIDADESSRLVVAPGTPGLERVVGRFGPGVLTAGGELDRRALRNIIFSDPRLRAELESILHPLIRSDMDERSARAEGPYIVLAVPLLVEGGAARDRVDRILVVDADEGMQLERLMARDASTATEARAILAAQASRGVRLAAADEVLDNSGSVSKLRHAVDCLHQKYLSLAASLDDD